MVVYIVDIKYLICHVNLQDHVTERSCDFMEESFSMYIVIGNYEYDDITYFNLPRDLATPCGQYIVYVTNLICHVTLQDYVIKRSFDIMEEIL